LLHGGGAHYSYFQTFTPSFRTLISPLFWPVLPLQLKS